jgi:hypothetical protein
LVLFHLHKTLENQDFEKALVSVDKKELQQGWFKLGGCAQLPFDRLQSTASYILRFKVCNKMYIFIENRDN